MNMLTMFGPSFWIQPKPGSSPRLRRGYLRVWASRMMMSTSGTV